MTASTGTSFPWSEGPNSSNGYRDNGAAGNRGFRGRNTHLDSASVLLLANRQFGLERLGGEEGVSQHLNTEAPKFGSSVFRIRVSAHYASPALTFFLSNS